jgi:hypothetical protein
LSAAALTAGRKPRYAPVAAFGLARCERVAEEHCVFRGTLSR